MTRALCITLLCVASAISAQGQQNLVSNCSFEQYTQCPTNISNLTADCVGWYAFTNGTSDYFNACHTSIYAGVPWNFLGTQAAARGQAYAGIINYYGILDYKEYLASPITRMTVGASYEVSMSISLADSVDYAANDLGVLFIDQGYTTKPGTGRLSLVPQIDYSSYGIITDHTNWTRIKASFVADSAYQRMVIGGFKPSYSMPVTYVGPANFGYAYYYIDSVVVRKTSTIFYDFTDTTLCIGDTFTVPFHTDPSFIPGFGNVFYVQMSDINGSFSSATTIGSTSVLNGGIFCTIPLTTTMGKGYKLRIVSTAPADTTAATMSIGIGTPVSKPIAYNNGPYCLNSVLALFAGTTTVSPYLKWAWTGPNNFNTTTQNPTIGAPTVANSGDYIVTASLFGCSAKDTTSVVVLPVQGPGTGMYITSNLPICAGDTLKLYAIGANTGSVYSWTGPNSFTAATQNPVIPYAGLSAVGQYTVSASLNGCTISSNGNITIRPGPANFSASHNGPLCEGSTYNLSASSTSTGVTYSWTGPNSFTSSLTSPSISNVNSSHAGNYIITATTVAPFNCKTRDTFTLVVNPLPAKPVASSNTPACSGSNLNLYAATTTGGVNYGWIGPNSFIASSQNPTIVNSTVAASGNYIVTAMVAATGCIAKDTETVLVRPTPVVNALGNTPVCEGSALNLSATATPMGTFSWTGPNAYSSSTQNPSITNISLTGDGSYIASATLNGCTGKDTFVVQVKATPSTPVVGSNGVGCIGAQLQLTATSTIGASYSWTGPTGFSSTLQNPSRYMAISNDAGIYSVTASMNGCTSAPGTINIVLTPTPFVVIYAVPGDTICQGSTVSYTALPANISANATYKWTKNSSPSVLSTTNTFVSTSINNNDVIRCELTEPVKCGSTYIDTSNEIKMTVLPWLAPSVSITCSPNAPLAPYETITFTAHPVNGGNSPKYQWRKNLTDQIGANSYTWGTMQIDDKDSVSVLMISDYKCPQPKTATSNKIKVTVLTGVNDVKGNGNITLYPNPNNGFFTIKGNVNTNKEVTIQIVNALGQLVYETTCLPNNKELNTQINVEHLAKGVYSLRIKTATINTIKFSIE